MEIWGCPEVLGSVGEYIGVARMPNTWRLVLLGGPGCWGLGVWGDRGAGNLEVWSAQAAGNQERRGMGLLRVMRDWRQEYWGAPRAAVLDTWRRGYQDVLGFWEVEGCIGMSQILGTERMVLECLRCWGPGHGDYGVP